MKFKDWWHRLALKKKMAEDDVELHEAWDKIYDAIKDLPIRDVVYLVHCMERLLYKT